MRLILIAALALAAGSASAQTAPAAAPPRAYDPAPWWMDKPIIASTGYVTTEVEANRASLSATYDAVDRDVSEATKQAIQKARAITGSLQTFGPEKVRVETRVNMTPLYEQYRDKQGDKVDNQRADKIDRYQVSVQVSVEIRDMRLVEPVYSILMSAKPSSTTAVSFRLEPGDETRTQMFKRAVEDAHRRAELAASAAGAKLGPVRLIDPTGRACQTDVLVALAPRGYGGAEPFGVPAPPPPPSPAYQSRSVEEMVVTAQRKAQDAGLKPEDLQLPVQPPQERLQANACVVYSLG